MSEMREVPVGTLQGAIQVIGDNPSGKFSSASVAQLLIELQRCLEPPAPPPPPEEPKATETEPSPPVATETPPAKDSNGSAPYPARREDRRPKEAAATR